MGSLPFLLSKKESRIFFRQTPKKTPRNTDNARASSPNPAVRPDWARGFGAGGAGFGFSRSAPGALRGAPPFSGRRPPAGRPGRRPPAGQMGAGLRPAKWAPVSGRQNGRRSPAGKMGAGLRPAKRQGRQTGGQRRGLRPSSPVFCAKIQSFFCGWAPGYRLTVFHGAGTGALVIFWGSFFMMQVPTADSFSWCGLGYFLWQFFFARKYKAFFVAGPQAIGLQFFMVWPWSFFVAVFFCAKIQSFFWTRPPKSHRRNSFSGGVDCG